jgi:carbon storage regulator CsrA
VNAVSRPDDIHFDGSVGHHRLVVRTFAAGQGITIGDEIEFSVLAVMGDSVRIAMQAPDSTQMFRRDLATEGPGRDPEATAPEADDPPAELPRP